MLRYSSLCALLLLLAGCGEAQNQATQSPIPSTNGPSTNGPSTSAPSDGAAPEQTDGAAEAIDDHNKGNAQSISEIVERDSAGKAASSWCSAVGKRTSVEACAGYAEEISSLTKGVAAFDPPRNMVKGDTRVVRLGIARDDGSQPSRATEIVGGDADTAVRGVEIGSKMRAQLSGGAAFDIDPSAPQDKFMGRAKEQVWAWNVTPKLAGKHSLSATITVLAEDGTVLDNFESKAIEVDIAVSQADARKANRDRTREDIAWYEDLGKLLTDLWAVWIGLAVLVAVGIWRFIRAAKTGKDPAMEVEEAPDQVKKKTKSKKPK